MFPGLAFGPRPLLRDQAASRAAVVPWPCGPTGPQGRKLWWTAHGAALPSGCKGPGRLPCSRPGLGGEGPCAGSPSVQLCLCLGSRDSRAVSCFIPCSLSLCLWAPTEALSTFPEPWLWGRGRPDQGDRRPAVSGVFCGQPSQASGLRVPGGGDKPLNKSQGQVDQRGDAGTSHTWSWPKAMPHAGLLPTPHGGHTGPNRPQAGEEG